MELNHTIVWAADPEKSATFYADVRRIGASRKSSALFPLGLFAEQAIDAREAGANGWTLHHTATSRSQP